MKIMKGISPKYWKIPVNKVYVFYTELNNTSNEDHVDRFQFTKLLKKYHES